MVKLRALASPRARVGWELEARGEGISWQFGQRERTALTIHPVAAGASTALRSMRAEPAVRHSAWAWKVGAVRRMQLDITKTSQKVPLRNLSMVRSGLAWPPARTMSVAFWTRRPRS